MGPHRRDSPREVQVSGCVSTSPTAAALIVVVVRAATPLVVLTGVDAREVARLLTSVDGGTGSAVRMETGEELVVSPRGTTGKRPGGERRGRRASPIGEASQMNNATQTATTPRQAARPLSALTKNRASVSTDGLIWLILSRPDRACFT